MIDYAAVHEHNRNGKLDEQPNDDIDSLRSFKQFACILDAKHRLRHHDSTVHPTLCAKPLAIWIRHIDVVLSETIQNEKIVFLAHTHVMRLLFISTIFAAMQTKSYLTDGATIKPINTRRMATIGCDGGISNICFKKNVLSSVICQKITSCDTDKNRIQVDFGFNHRTVVQLTGVNCNTARFILPVVVEMSRMLAHLYSRISSILQIFSPHQIPRPLHISTSKINASHQHSMKLGKRWANVISVISHITEIAHNIPTWRMRMAYWL